MKLNWLLQIPNGYMQPYRTFESSVKPRARKMRIWENKKGASIDSDSPFWVWISSRYPKWTLREFRLNCSGIWRLRRPLKNGISQQNWGFEKLVLVGVIATFGKQILLPINRRNQRDGSIMISLQYLRLWGCKIFGFYLWYLKFRLSSD